MNFNTNNPIYLQLLTHICHQIVRGEIKSGEKLPAVRETAMNYGVNPNTVQRTYSELERKRVIESRRGLGSFVTTNQETIKNLRDSQKEEEFKNFIGIMNDMGITKQEVIYELTQFVAKKGE